MFPRPRPTICIYLAIYAVSLLRVTSNFPMFGEPNLSATSFLDLLVNGRQASTLQNGQYLRNKDTLCGRSGLSHSPRMPRRRWFGSTFSDSPARTSFWLTAIWGRELSISKSTTRILAPSEAHHHRLGCPRRAQFSRSLQSGLPDKSPVVPSSTSLNILVLEDLRAPTGRLKWPLRNRWLSNRQRRARSEKS
jgi:hypothetical protein